MSARAVSLRVWLNAICRDTNSKVLLLHRRPTAASLAPSAALAGVLSKGEYDLHPPGTCALPAIEISETDGAAEPEAMKSTLFEWMNSSRSPLSAVIDRSSGSSREAMKFVGSRFAPAYGSERALHHFFLVDRLSGLESVAVEDDIEPHVESLDDIVRKLNAFELRARPLVHWGLQQVSSCPDDADHSGRTDVLAGGMERECSVRWKIHDGVYSFPIPSNTIPPFDTTNLIVVTDPRQEGPRDVRWTARRRRGAGRAGGDETQ